jgi:hypothetical protein
MQAQSHRPHLHRSSIPRTVQGMARCHFPNSSARNVQSRLHGRPIRKGNGFWDDACGRDMPRASRGSLAEHFGKHRDECVEWPYQAECDAPWMLCTRTPRRSSSGTFLPLK